MYQRENQDGITVPEGTRVLYINYHFVVFHESRVDWERIIEDLRDNEFSHQSISEFVLVPKSSIQNWKNGAEPRFYDGLNLISLWCTFMKKGFEEVPRIHEESDQQ